MNTTPGNQAATSRDKDQVWPVRVVRRGDAVRPLPPHARSLADLTFEVGDVRLSVSDYMACRRTAGLLILKNGEIALERYDKGRGPERVWHGYSTAKSITATLVGAALHDGAIGSLDDRCDLYLPRPVFFSMLTEETEPAVRVVLGHFIFVYIHPYTDGNGRTARFLMNVMLAAGGYPWTVVPVEQRAAYFATLEDASVRQNIVPFADFLAALVRDGLQGRTVATVPATQP